MEGKGIEIGAHDVPIKGISPIYVDRFLEFAGTKCLVDVVGDASSLPFRDNSLDYVASSHLFEHLANPVLALCEWYRCLKAGGVIYLVVPDRRFTFDHRRQRTSLSHLISDFENDTSSCDANHIDDFVDTIDLTMVAPALSASDFSKFREEQKVNYRDAVKAGREINIHFHVFEKEDVIQLVRFMTAFKKANLKWSIVEVQERYPPAIANGFLIVIRKNTTVRWKVFWSALKYRTRR